MIDAPGRFKELGEAESCAPGVSSWQSLEAQQDPGSPMSHLGSEQECLYGFLRH